MSLLAEPNEQSVHQELQGHHHRLRTFVNAIFRTTAAALLHLTATVNAG